MGAPQQLLKHCSSLWEHHSSWWKHRSSCCKHHSSLWEHWISCWEHRSSCWKPRRSCWEHCSSVWEHRGSCSQPRSSLWEHTSNRWGHRSSLLEHCSSYLSVTIIYLTHTARKMKYNFKIVLLWLGVNIMMWKNFLCIVSHIGNSENEQRYPIRVTLPMCSKLYSCFSRCIFGVEYPWIFLLSHYHKLYCALTAYMAGHVVKLLLFQSSNIWRSYMHLKKICLKSDLSPLI